MRIGFALAHCIELTIKAAYWQIRKRAPEGGHRVDAIIRSLRSDVGNRFARFLPRLKLRKKFEARVDAMNRAPPMDMLNEFFELNPNFNDEEWMFLYALFRSVHVKYGVDNKQAVLKVFQPVKPRLNKMALRLIGSARKSFPRAEHHRRKIADFVDNLPKKYDIIAEMRKLGRGRKAQDTPDYMKGKAPPPPLLFDAAELRFLRRTLRVGRKARRRKA